MRAPDARGLTGEAEDAVWMDYSTANIIDRIGGTHMKSNDTMNPLWTGFLDLLRSLFVIEIGYIFYSLVMTGELLP